MTGVVIKIRSLLKSLVKRLPHSLLMRIYHRWHVRECRAAANTAAQQLGIPRLDTFDISTLKRTDTLFVLGSGPSINRISPARWKGIASYDTAGFNFWPFHPFVPRMYFFESIPYESQEANISAEMYSVVKRMLIDRAAAYARVTKIITDVGVHRDTQLIFDLPSQWLPNLYVAYTVPVIARTETELTIGIRYLKKRRLFTKARRFWDLFKYCGSLSSIISVGVRMGYRRIVLCGIDMGKQEYFFQDRELFPRTASLEFGPKEHRHYTAEGQQWMVPMQVVVSVLMREVLEPAGVELYLENSASALAPLVPVVPTAIFAC